MEREVGSPAVALIASTDKQIRTVYPILPIYSYICKARKHMLPTSMQAIFYLNVTNSVARIVRTED